MTEKWLKVCQNCIMDLVNYIPDDGSGSSKVCKILGMLNIDPDLVDFDLEADSFL